MRNKKRENSNIRKDILKILDNAFPGDVIDMWGGFEESHLADNNEDLKTKLSTIETATLNYERDWQGNDPRFGNYYRSSNWDNEKDDFDDPIPLPMGDISSSYHLFFLGLNEERFRLECEDETLDDEGNRVQVKGTRSPGCSVGISLLAPFALIMTGSIEVFEDGSYTCPDIETHVFEWEGDPADIEEYTHTPQIAEKETEQALKELTDRITSILESFGIFILPDEEAEKPVPWLKPGEEACIETLPDEVIKLKNVFFFRGVF
jgi:hypothetical protein